MADNHGLGATEGWAATIAVLLWIGIAVLASATPGFDAVAELWTGEPPAGGFGGGLLSPAAGGALLVLLVLLQMAVFWAVLFRGVLPRCGDAPSWRIAAGVSLVATVVLLLSPPFLSNDPFLYQHYAWVEEEGANPYLVADVQAAVAASPETRERSFWAGQASPYGALVQRLTHWVHRPGQSLRANTVLLRLLWIAIFFGFVAIVAIDRRAGPEWPALRWLLLCQPLILLEVVLEVHTELLLVVLVYFALLAVRSGRATAAIALLVGSLAVKPIALLLLPPIAAFLLRQKRARALLPIALGTIAGVLFLGLVWAAYWQGPQTLEPLVRESQRYLKSFAAVGALIWQLDPKAIGRAGLTATALVIGVVTWRTRSFEKLLEGLQIVLLVYLTVGVPFFQSWYLLWLLPLVCVSPTWLRDRRWLLGAAIFTTTAWLGSYGLTLASPTRGRPLVAMSLLCLLPFVLYGGAVFLRRRRRGGMG